MAGTSFWWKFKRTTNIWKDSHFQFVVEILNLQVFINYEYLLSWKMSCHSTMKIQPHKNKLTFIYVFMYIFIYVHLYMCIYTHMYVYMCVICTHICMCVCVFVYIYLFIVEFSRVANKGIVTDWPIHNMSTM